MLTHKLHEPRTGEILEALGGEESSSAGSAPSHPRTERSAPLEALTDTLIERVDKLIQASKTPLEWGSPRLSVTPDSVAIRELAAETEALETAVREIALEVEKLSAQR